MKNNSNQVCFLFHKVKLQDYHHGFKTMKEFLDFKQYSVNSILRYEKIYGYGFVSTGGNVTTEEFLDKLELKPNQRVLDVGCAIGGCKEIFYLVFDELEILNVYFPFLLIDSADFLMCEVRF